MKRFSIRSRDHYYLTANRCHSAVVSQRWIMSDLAVAQAELAEAQKWNPSCEIIDETPAPLTWGEVREMMQSVPHHIAAWKMANNAADQSALAMNARHRRSVAINTLHSIGDRLCIELVPGCASITALIDKFADHGYRPTLREDAGAPYKLLADIYDVVAQSRGLTVRAYRG